MKLSTILFLGASSSLWASAGLSTPGGRSSAIRIPASTIDTAGSFHMQARLHGVSWTPTGAIFSAGGYGLLSGSGAIAFAAPDLNSEGTGNCILQMGGVTDVTLDITRDLTVSAVFPQGFVRGEIFSTSTGALIGSCTFTITGKASGAAIAGNGIIVGNTNRAGNIAFIRWYSGAFPSNSAIQPYVATPAPWLDYEFLSNGTGDDTSGRGQNIAGLTFASTPSFPPVCNAGVPQTATAGNSLALDGSGSYSLNGNAVLHYSWNYSGGGSDGVTQTPAYSDTSAAGPTVTGLGHFGSFNSQLVVTDSSQVQSVCGVHNGVVAANGVGAIDLTAEGLSPVQQLIVGPQVAYGRNPWPWADVAVSNELNLQASHLVSGGFYEPYWRTLQPGSITVSAGSSTVTGSGTAFKALFCSGGNSPDGSLLSWQYRGTDGLTHYGQFQIVSCPDDTHVIISANFYGSPSPFVYPSSPNAPWPVCTTPCTGMGYGRVDTSGPAFNYWLYTPSPANYYDNVMFFLVGYWRSGIDTYYSAAQALATYWMEWPQLDYYYNCNYEVNNYSPGGAPLCPGESRELALTGMVLWEQQPGNSWLLPALENVGQKYSAYAGRLPTFMGLNDMRDDAYVFAGLATLSLIETHADKKANYQNLIRASLGRLWTPYLRTSPFTGWNQFYFGYQDSITLAGGGGSVDVSPGSTTVTGHGTAFDSSLTGNTIWTFPAPAGTLPEYCGTCSASGWVNGGDSQSWVITAVDQSRQTLTLADAYIGTANLTARGFATGGTSGIPGWGFQPFMLGLLGTSFFLDAQAMDGYDATAQSTFLDYGHIAVNLLPALISPDQGGFYNGAYYPGCAPPMYTSSTMAQLYCYGAMQFYQGVVWNSQAAFTAGAYAIYNGGQYRSRQSGNTNHQPDPSGNTWWSPVPMAVGPADGRQLTAEAMRAFSFDFQYFGTSAATANLQMSRMFSKPGTGGPNPDGYYLTGYDLATNPPGWYVQGTGGDPRAKWAGQLAGFSEAAVTWPGVVALMNSRRSAEMKGKVRTGGTVTQ